MNSELRRNLWLHATRRKLAFAGAVLAGVFVAVWLLDRGRHAYAVTLAGAVVFCASALGWAPWAARASVTHEARTGTWEAQRLSALSPWAMTWGKLAGSTARTWATAAGGLLLAALQLASTSSFGHAAFWVLTALGLAATLQASGLATGVLDVRRARASGRSSSARAPGLLLLVLGLLSLVVLVWLRERVGEALARLALQPGGGAGGTASGPLIGVDWFGRAFTPLAFAAPTLAGLAVWAGVWAWRSVRLELQFAGVPWVWALFLACVGLYAFGFKPSDTAPSAFAARLAMAGLAWAALAYVAAFAEAADRVRARQFASALRGRRPMRLLTHLPAPALAAVLAMGAAFVVALVRARQGDGAVAAGVVAAAAFLARDLGLITWRRFALGRRRGGDGGVLLLLVGLYALVFVGRLFGGGRGQALFAPTLAEPRFGLAVAGLEAGAAWMLAAFSLSRLAPRPWTPPPPPEPAKTMTAVPVTPDNGDALEAG